MVDTDQDDWRSGLRQHLTVFGLAIVFGLGAYAVVSLFIYINRLIGLS